MAAFVEKWKSAEIFQLGCGLFCEDKLEKFSEDRPEIVVKYISWTL